jgi:hypothetical protein
MQEHPWSRTINITYKDQEIFVEELHEVFYESAFIVEIHFKTHKT